MTTHSRYLYILRHKQDKHVNCLFASVTWANPKLMWPPSLIKNVREQPKKLLVKTKKNNPMKIWVTSIPKTSLYILWPHSETKTLPHYYTNTILNFKLETINRFQYFWKNNSIKKIIKNKTLIYNLSSNSNLKIIPGRKLKNKFKFSFQWDKLHEYIYFIILYI